jgi:hypothetical protein
MSCRFFGGRRLYNCCVKTVVRGGRKKIMGGEGTK